MSCPMGVRQVMRSEAQIIRLTQSGYVGPALASRYPVGQVADPTLLSALALWQEVAPTGILYRSEIAIDDVLMDPRLNRARATVIQTIGSDPFEWPIVYHGWGFADWRTGARPPACRVGELPWPALARATAESYADVLTARSPVVHRLSMFSPGLVIIYDRIAFPSSRAQGSDIDTLLTVSASGKA